MKKNLEKISMWAYQWKMSFNPNISKQAEEIILSKKNLDVSHSPLYFNKIPVVVCSFQKHLGVFLDREAIFSTPYLRRNCKSK